MDIFLDKTEVKQEGMIYIMLAYILPEILCLKKPTRFLPFLRLSTHYNYDLSQGSTNWSSRAKSGPPLAFVNKYWNTKMPICLLTAHGGLYTWHAYTQSKPWVATAHISLPTKPKNTYYLTLYRKNLLTLDWTFFKVNFPSLFLLLFF